MATLDVLDYALRLDEALARDLRPAERKMAVKDARRVIEDLAFRNAIADRRPMPEDLDFARALEAMKPPERAAPVLARRRPHYVRRRRRKLVTTFVTLGVLAATIGAFSNFVASETADVLVDTWRVGSTTPITESRSQVFEVAPGTTRVQLTASVVVFTDRAGARENTVTLSLLDPAGIPRYEQTFTSANAVYGKTAIEVPAPGTWEIFVDFRDAAGSAEITVLGVRAS